MKKISLLTAMLALVITAGAQSDKKAIDEKINALLNLRLRTAMNASNARTPVITNILQPDPGKMPCVVPDMRQFNMPNAGSMEMLRSAAPMPNIALSRVDNRVLKDLLDKKNLLPK